MSNGWQDRALAAEAELAELRGMLDRVTHEIDRLRLRCEQFEGTGVMVTLFRELAAVLRTMRDPAPADDTELGVVVPMHAAAWGGPR